MPEGRRIRSLVEKNVNDPNRATLDEVFNLLVSASGKARDLEYKNTDADCKALKRILRESRKKLDEFYDRVRHEVTDEVNAHRAKNKHKYPGNSEALAKARQVKSQNQKK